MSTARGMLAAGLAISSRASGQLCLIAVTLVATRYLSPADFGMFALATVFVTLARTLLYAGPFEYQMKAPDLDRVATEALAANVLMASGCAVLLALIAIPAGPLFGSPHVGLLLLALAPSNLLASLASWLESLVLRSGKLRGYYIATMAVEAMTSVLAVAMLVSGWGLWALAAQIYIRLILLAVTYRFLVVPPKLNRVDPEQLREVLRWSISRYGSVFVTYLSNYSGDLILGIVLSPAATGIFRAGNRIVTAAADMFAQPARMLAMTILSRRSAAQMPADAFWVRILAAIGFIGFPALLAFALLAPPLTPLLLGKQWAAAAPVISILCFARAANLVNNVLSAQFVAYDKARLVFRTQLTAMFVVAGLTIAGARYGVAGAAWAACTGAVMTTGVYLVAALRMGRAHRRDWRSSFYAIFVPIDMTLALLLAEMLLNPFPQASAIEKLAVAGFAGGLGWLTACVIVRRSITHSLASLRTDS